MRHREKQKSAHRKRTFKNSNQRTEFSKQGNGAVTIRPATESQPSELKPDGLPRVEGENGTAMTQTLTAIRGADSETPAGLSGLPRATR